MKEIPENEFDNLFASARAVTATIDLRERAERAARLHQTTVPLRTPARLRLFLAAGSAFVIIGAALVVPIAAGGSTLISKTALALQNVDSMHMTWTDIANGKPLAAQQIWYSKGDWRVEDPYSLVIYGSNKKWDHALGSPTVLERERQPGEVPPTMEDGIRVTDLIRALNRRGNKFEIEYGPKLTSNGEQTQSIIATRDSHYERYIIRVDLATDFPVAVEHDKLIDDAWIADVGATFQFGLPVEGSLFRPDFGPNVRVVDLDELRASDVANWNAVTDGPDLKAEGGDNRVRDTFVNQKGWVYVLWTGRIGGRTHRLTLTDDKGNQYERAAYFNPGASPYDYSKLPVVSVDGEVVDGAWFVPINDIDPSQVSRYELSASRLTIEGPGDGSLRQDLMRRPWEAAEPDHSGGHTTYTLTPVGNVGFERPAISKTLLPDFAPLFQGDPPTERFAEQWALEGRIWYLLATTSSDYTNGAGALVEEMPAKYLVGGPMLRTPQIAIPGRPLKLGQFNRSALTEVALLMRREIEVLRGRDSTGEVSAFDWYNLSLVEGLLGNIHEADQDLALARSLRPEINWGGAATP